MFECYTKPIEEAISKRIANKFCGIVGFHPWIHPCNAVVNCFALTLDGGIQYKFSLTRESKFMLAEIRSQYWIKLKARAGDTFTLKQLIKLIQRAECYDAFAKSKIRIAPVKA